MYARFALLVLLLTLASVSCDDDPEPQLIRPSYSWLAADFEADFDVLLDDGATPAGAMRWTVETTHDPNEFWLIQLYAVGEQPIRRGTLIQKSASGLLQRYASACPDSFVITEWGFETFLPSPIAEGDTFVHRTCLGVVFRHWTVLHVDHAFESRGVRHVGFVLLRQGWDIDQSLYYYSYDEGLIRIERRDGHWDGSWYRFDPDAPIRELIVRREDSSRR